MGATIPKKSALGRFLAMNSLHPQQIHLNHLSTTHMEPEILTPIQWIQISVTKMFTGSPHLPTRPKVKALNTSRLRGVHKSLEVTLPVFQKS